MNNELADKITKLKNKAGGELFESITYSPESKNIFRKGIDVGQMYLLIYLLENEKITLEDVHEYLERDKL